MRVLDTLNCTLIGTLYDRLLKRFPGTIRIETTNQCNARCVICPRKDMTRPVSIMNREMFARIVDECADHKLKTLHMHNFGEPLLDRSLFDRIGYAKQKGIRHVKIFSNGSLLNKDNAARLLDSGLDEIKVSIDGADRQEYESIRVGLKYGTVIENIRGLANERNRRGLKRPKILVACCTTSDRTRSMDNLKGLVDGYSFGRLHNWGDQGGRNRSLCRKPCYRIWSTFTILADGSVSLCCLDFDGKIILGSLAEGASITQIWTNERYRRMRQLHRSGNQSDISICRTCTKSFM